MRFKPTKKLTDRLVMGEHKTGYEIIGNGLEIRDTPDGTSITILDGSSSLLTLTYPHRILREDTGSVTIQMHDVRIVAPLKFD